MKKNGKLMFFLIAFLLSALVILFVGYDNNKFTLTTKGAMNFKRGLDIAGGVRLTYKIDLSKYKELYGVGSSEYRKIRQSVEEIILKNIDNRISKLGVSDYSSYVQVLNEDDYVVVEIGGLTDIEEAKNTIGKTVELEFKVPFDTGSADNQKMVADRMQKAKSIFGEIQKSPELFAQTGTGKQSDDVYYEHFTGNTMAQMPAVVSQNKEKIDQLKDGQVLPELLSGIYSVEFNNNQVTTLNGWTVVKFNGKKIEKLDKVTEAIISQVAKTFKLEKEEVYTKQEPAFGQGEFKYDTGKNEIAVNFGEDFTGKQAYNLRMYMFEKPDVIGKQADEVKRINEESQKYIDEIKNSLDKGTEVDTTGAKVLYNGWADKDSIVQSITGFSINSGETLKTFEQGSTTFIVKVKDTKNATEKIYKTIALKNVPKTDATKIQESLKTQESYDIEAIFIKDSPTWVTAKDPKSGNILNGAYFKYAGVDQGKTGTPVVTIQFDDTGKEIFCNLTQEHIGKRMAIFVGGELKTAPNIDEKICGGSAQISGGFTTEQAKKLSSDLNEGALPAKLILAHEDKISPSLGDHAIKGAIYAGLGGLLLIYLLLLYMYGPKKAALAIASLVIYLTILFAIVKLIGYALSLSAIAALLLNIGMGVDANILIFERLKEESKQGKSLSKAIDDGTHRSWPAIRDGNLTIAFIGALLYLIGTNIFKGFGFMMIVNILLTLFVLVPLVRELLIYFYIDKDSK